MRDPMLWSNNREEEFPIKPLSVSRLTELLDYATDYGRLDETLPDGLHPIRPSEMVGYTPEMVERAKASSVMTKERRVAITVLKQALGIIPVDLAGKGQKPSWKIVGIDNFNRESVADFLVAEGIENESDGKLMADALNAAHCTHNHAPYFYQLVPSSYRLCRGMEDLI